MQIRNIKMINNKLSANNECQVNVRFNDLDLINGYKNYPNLNGEVNLIYSERHK